MPQCRRPNNTIRLFLRCSVLCLPLLEVLVLPGLADVGRLQPEAVPDAPAHVDIVLVRRQEQLVQEGDPMVKLAVGGLQVALLRHQVADALADLKVQNGFE